MTFNEILEQVRELLQRKGRVSYRALKLQFNLDDKYLEGIKDELIEAEQLAIDEHGKVLVWTGGTAQSPASTLTGRQKGKRRKGEKAKRGKVSLESRVQSPESRVQTRLSRAPSVNGDVL